LIVYVKGFNFDANLSYRCIGERGTKAELVNMIGKFTKSCKESRSMNRGLSNQIHRNRKYSYANSKKRIKATQCADRIFSA